LNSCIKNEGPDSKNVANVNHSKGLFHLALAGYHKDEQLRHTDLIKKKKHLLMSKLCFTECLRIKALLDTKSYRNDKTKRDAEKFLEIVLIEIRNYGFDN
jgi:hypothetical protein